MGEACTPRIHVDCLSCTAQHSKQSGRQVWCKRGGSAIEMMMMRQQGRAGRQAGGLSRFVQILFNAIL